MIWIGIIIGFAVGVVFTTLLYVPLVEKVERLQHKLLHEQRLIDDAIKTLSACEKQNEHLRQDLTVMQRMVPRELYAQFFDGPYKDN